MPYLDVYAYKPPMNVLLHALAGIAVLFKYTAGQRSHATLRVLIVGMRMPQRRS
jgi:hypothetical protein